eukprot:CAMPEP_0171073544 /NCGR_PEP_ID=MMETSP0766_2-20121228/11576_1 /TAXON_ID=439317 /ORGANISM="Gambierdiscus australes, Strain CAWD 149" /LENGTH=119 /DNA_ID=CAMNT_0011530247 /DNA_START=54 /DNA_END=411 /DNA_ORIENTATION=-
MSCTHFFSLALVLTGICGALEAQCLVQSVVQVNKPEHNWMELFRAIFHARPTAAAAAAAVVAAAAAAVGGNSSNSNMRQLRFWADGQFLRHRLCRVPDPCRKTFQQGNSAETERGDPML